jgi:hypothetical protein
MAADVAVVTGEENDHTVAQVRRLCRRSSRRRGLSLCLYAD